MDPINRNQECSITEISVKQLMQVCEKVVFILYQIILFFSEPRKFNFKMHLTV